MSEKKIDHYDVNIQVNARSMGIYGDQRDWHILFPFMN